MVKVELTALIKMATRGDPAAMMAMAHHHPTKQHGLIGPATGLAMHSWRQYVSQLPASEAGDSGYLWQQKLLSHQQPQFAG
jgi:hypothetical protein